MADRSQNILINYKFNTSEIERANAILNRANDSTNKLQSEAQKSGQKISQSFGTAKRSIESMNIELARLKTQISVSSDPRRVAELSNQYKVLKQQIDQATASAFKLPKALNETKAATQSLSQQFGNLYTAARALVTAGILREVVNITLEMATLKGNVEGVEAAFKKAIPNEVAVLADLRKATKGTISDFELMKQALQAQNFGLPVEKLGRLLEFATAKAQQTGLSIDYITNSLVTGLGRKSERVFDNLQLDIAELRKRIASGLDFREAGIQLIEEDLAKMGGVMTTTATTADQLRESWQALRIEFAKKIESGGVISFFEGVTDGLTALLKGNKQVQEEFLRQIGAEQAARFKESETFKQAGADRQKQFDAIQQEINTRVELIGRTNDSIAAKKDEIKNAQVWSNTLKKFVKTTRGEEVEAIRDQITELEKRKFVQAAAILALKDYLKALQDVTDQEVEGFETIEKLEEKRQKLIDQREKETFTGNTAELDRLQREILLLDDRILKISDNIKWQQQWNHEKQQSALTTQTETENLEKFNAELDKLTQRIAGGALSFSTGDVLTPDVKEIIDVEALEESLKEVADQIPDSFFTRFRLAWKNAAEDSQNELQQQLNEAMDSLKLGSIDILRDQLMAEAELEGQALKARLKATKDFYDQQQILAGDNQRARDLLRLREEKETTKIQRQIFEKEKQTRRSQAIIDGAAGVVKAFATYAYPAALVISGLIAAQTLSNIRIINRQRPGFAKGVIGLKGPGTETSDSIPVNLSKNESVMTAWATRNAGDVLKEVQAKKLDNKVLKELKQGRSPIQQQQFNDERIIKAIKDNRPPDVVEQAGIAYDVKEKGDNYRLKIRKASGRFRI